MLKAVGIQHCVSGGVNCRKNILYRKLKNCESTVVRPSMSMNNDFKY